MAYAMRGVFLIGAVRRPKRTIALGRLAVVLVTLGWFACLPTAAADPTFENYWQDGHAELSGYAWTVTRYGQPRNGWAVAIYVTEPFSKSKQVKADNPTRKPADTFEAFKLNLARDFQTGVYDYNTMASVFVDSARFSPVKETFTSAEWCGHVYEEMLFAPGRISQQVFSYFEGESASQTLKPMADGVIEDNLFILLRGLRGEFLKPGEKKSVPFLPSPFYRRLTHQPISWTAAQIHRLHKSENVEIPAGVFDADVYVVKTTKGREGRFHVERAYPHRIVKWSWKPAPGKNTPNEALDTGQLTGTARLKYWQLHGNGHEKHLERLGLPTAALRRE